MKGTTLKLTCLVAALYFGMEVDAQRVAGDTATKERKIEEVVMIGYGSAKKVDLAGSISKVDGATVADKPNTNPVSSIQGKVAGVTIVNDGKPGSSPDIRIRGTSSFYHTSPLYVVDGLFTDNIDYLNPSDIESMDILKDPSSLAIFGVRGANGVIIVTTKQAKRGSLTVNFNTSVGAKFITGVPKMTNAAQFRALYDQQRINDGFAPYAYYKFYNADTNWIKEISNNGAMTQNNALTISSAGEKNRINFGLGYTTDQGLIKNEVLKKLTVYVNDELQITNNLKVGVDINLAQQDLPQLHDFIPALLATPIVSPIDGATGLYNQLPIGLGDSQIGNPLANVNLYANHTDRNKQYKIAGNVFAELKFLKDFTFRASFLGDYSDTKERRYTPVFSMNVSETGGTNYFGSNSMTRIFEKDETYGHLQQDYLLTYMKRINDHSITALAGYTYSYDNHSFNGLNASQGTSSNSLPIPNDPRFWYTSAYPFVDPSSVSVETGPKITATSSAADIINKFNYLPWERATSSILARVLYSYKNKYILNGSYRRDGSSDISPKNRYFNAWSVGAAWDISKEDFLNGNKVVNLLKLKGSYGVLGNQVTPIHYAYLPNYIPGNVAIFNGNIIPAYTAAYQVDPNLKWEDVKSYEAGFELGLGHKFTLEAVYYNKTTENLLAFINNGTFNYFSNVGTMYNRGFEATASYRQNVSDNFKIDVSGNITTIKNMVTKINAGDDYNNIDGGSILEAGHPIGSFYGYVVDGVYQSQVDILKSPVNRLASVAPGDLKFRDINGDGVIDAKDRTILGNPTPDFTYGFSLNFTFKNVYLNTDFQGVYGNEVYRDWGNGPTYTQFNYRTAALGAWNGPGTSNWEPRLSSSSASYNQLPSSYMIEDGSYFRVRNVQLGYIFNRDLIGTLHMRSLKAYVNVQNLYTWKHTSGFSPELGGTPLKFGVDSGGYPVPVIASLGLNATF